MADHEQRGEPERTRRVRIWDRPTRVFHWLLVVLFVMCFASGKAGRLDIHMVAGQTLLVLVVARIVWGIFGSETSRLRGLVRPPAEIVLYLQSLFRRTPDHSAGHNPLGGISVLVMFVALVGQAVMGLLAVDADGVNEGPLSFLLNYEAARVAAKLHHLGVDLLILLVVVHILAVLFHLLYKRENLIVAMFTGNARLPEASREPAFAPDGRALLILALSAAAIFGGIEAVSRLL